MVVPGLNYSNKNIPVDTNNMKKINDWTSNLSEEDKRQVSNAEVVANIVSLKYGGALLGVIPGKEHKNPDEVKGYYYNYRGESLGQGTEGEVLLVPKEHKKGTKALKIEHGSIVHKKNGVQNEFLTLKELYRGTGLRKVRGVAPMGTLFRFDNKICLLTRRADFDLKTMVDKYPQLLNPKIMEGFIDDLKEGLEYIHSRNICSGDIKPGNILVRKKDGVYEAYHSDFGMAGHYGALPHGSNCMTMGGVDGHALTGNNADLFALGVSLWQLCTKNALLRNQPFKTAPCFSPVHQRVRILQNIDPKREGAYIRKELEKSGISKYHQEQILRMLRVI